jgi:hypothetical protein
MSDFLDMSKNASHNIGGIAPASGHQEGHRTDGARFKDIVNPTQHWQYKQQPTPGALAYAYETFGLPEFGVVESGIGSSYFFKLFQKPSYQSNKSVSIAGLGGIVAGTIRSQPLYDRQTNTWGGAEFTA